MLASFVLMAAIAADLRLGIVGTDTSHVIAFTKILNDPANPEHIPGAKVVALYKGGSPDIESSASRVEGYAKELAEKWKVEVLPEISAMCGKVDAVFLESVDGRKHLPQFRELVKCGKPVFIDKPLASTLADAREIDRLAKQAKVPWFSSSSLRYATYVTELAATKPQGAITWGPGPLEEHHQLDLSWYAVHPIEALYTILGPGCEEVTRRVGANADEITCRWKDGRMGTVRALRPYGDYGAVVFLEKTIKQSPPAPKFSYLSLLKEVIPFFQTGKPPVPNEVTLEMFAFMDAAQRSKAAGGAPMKLK
ncbi:MAG: Gfo/Idh/MocA family oxidoreductase [Acidobacteria bacterium]|nr:Gfo/Idh/MocA family oxidoreductase [Acidobacteriota bacterium]